MLSRSFGPPVQWSAGPESQMICEPKDQRSAGPDSSVTLLPSTRGKIHDVFAAVAIFPVKHGSPYSRQSRIALVTPWLSAW
jgi:hypothetical protein